MQEDSVEYRNFKAVEAHSNETRKFLRVNDAKVVGLTKTVETLVASLALQQQHIGLLLSKVNNGEAT